MPHQPAAAAGMAPLRRGQQIEGGDGADGSRARQRTRARWVSGCSPDTFSKTGQQAGQQHVGRQQLAADGGDVDLLADHRCREKGRESR